MSPAIAFGEAHDTSLRGKLTAVRHRIDRAPLGPAITAATE
jgi:hypothetical protein